MYKRQGGSCRVFKDKGYSGKNTDRPEFQKLLGDVYKRQLLGGAKLPKMDVLKEEGRKLTAKKKQLYGEYQKARRDMQAVSYTHLGRL